MTLIVCLRAQECVVFAADTLTNVSGRVQNCKTVKVHKLSDRTVVAGCGWAGMPLRKWHDVFKGFKPPAAAGGTLANLSAMLGAIKASLDGLVSLPRRNDIGACRGGNTFLAAILDPASGDIAVEKFTRVGDARAFPLSVTASPAVQTNYIEFIGDTHHLQGHIAAVRGSYVAGMSRADAIIFAKDAIKDAIPIARNAEVQSIGGHSIRVLTLSGSGVAFRRFTSGVACP